MRGRLVYGRTYETEPLLLIDSFPSPNSVVDPDLVTLGSEGINLLFDESLDRVSLGIKLSVDGRPQQWEAEWDSRRRAVRIVPIPPLSYDVAVELELTQEAEAPNDISSPIKLAFRTTPVSPNLGELALIAGNSHSRVGAFNGRELVGQGERAVLANLSRPLRYFSCC